jgi:5,10-methylenetetrahydromethanopterin reductase
VVLHGATPTELAPVVAAWRDLRPDGLDRLPENPGLA